MADKRRRVIRVIGWHVDHDGFKSIQTICEVAQRPRARFNARKLKRFVMFPGSGVTYCQVQRKTQEQSDNYWRGRDQSHG
jgi:hypothetical protein